MTARESSTRSGGTVSILIVDGADDVDAVAFRLRCAGFDVDVAEPGADAFRKMALAPIDFVLVDVRRQDRRSIDGWRIAPPRAREPRARTAGPSLGTRITAPPDDPRHLAGPIVAGETTVDDRPGRRVVRPAVGGHAADAGTLHSDVRSASQRWASLVVKACRSPYDLKTLSAWATFVAVSCSSLCEAARLVRIQPHHGRDFMRALRALIWASHHGCDPEVLLDLSDRRTLSAFCARAGGGFRIPCDVGEFVRQQTFIPPDNRSAQLVVAHFAAVNPVAMLASPADHRDQAGRAATRKVPRNVPPKRSTESGRPRTGELVRSAPPFGRPDGGERAKLCVAGKAAADDDPGDA